MNRSSPGDLLRRAAAEYAAARDPYDRLQKATASLQAAILMLREASAADAEVEPLVDLSRELNDWLGGAKPPMLASVKRTATASSDKWLLRLMSVILYDAMVGLEKTETVALQQVRKIYRDFHQQRLERKDINQWRREASREKPKMGAAYALHLDAYRYLRALMNGDAEGTSQMNPRDRFARAEKTALMAMQEAAARLRS